MASSRKISFVIDFLSVNGPGYTRISLAREMLTQGYKVDIVANKIDLELKQHIPLECKTYELCASRLFVFILKFGMYLRKEKPDGIIVSSWPYTVSSIISAKLFNRNTKIIVSEHSDFRTSLFNSLEYKKKDIFYIKNISRFIYKFADCIACVSNGVADGLSEAAGVNRKKIKVINNPLRLFNDTKNFNKDVEMMNSFWKNEDKKILSIGRLVSEKSFEVLIESIYIMKRDDVKLIIIGSGPLEGKIRELICRYKLGEKIFLAGKILNVHIFYEKADLFVVTSSCEGLCNVIIEALSFGVPVVSTDCQSGPSEILGNGKWGSLVPVGSVEKLSECIEESLCIQHDRFFLKKRADYFSANLIACKYIDAFNF